MLHSAWDDVKFWRDRSQQLEKNMREERAKTLLVEEQQGSGWTTLLIGVLFGQFLTLVLIGLFR